MVDSNLSVQTGPSPESNLLKEIGLDWTLDYRRKNGLWTLGLDFGLIVMPLVKIGCGDS